MTQEQKAKKYDEALEWMRKIYPTLTGADKEDAEHYFPELAESEDERIRKELVDMINECTNWIHKKEYVKYLEKQKENPKSFDSIPSDCTSDAKCENRWHKVGDSLPDNGRLVLAQDNLGNRLLARYDGEGNWEVSVYDNEDYYCRNTITKWCEIPSEKQKEPENVSASTMIPSCWEEEQKEQKPRNNSIRGKIISRATSEKQVVLISASNGKAEIGWDTRSLEDTKKLLEYGLAFINRNITNPTEKQKEQKSIIQDVELNDAVYDYVRDHFIAGADFTPEYIKKLIKNAFFAGVDYYLLKQEPAEWSEEDKLWHKK